MLAMNFVLPLSMLSSSASSSAFWSIKSASFQISASRCDGRSSRQGPPSNARRAACTARSTSAAFASATVAIWRPVAGSYTGTTASESGSTHSPPMKSRGGRFRNSATFGEGAGCAAIAALMVSPSRRTTRQTAFSRKTGPDTIFGVGRVRDALPRARTGRARNDASTPHDDRTPEASRRRSDEMCSDEDPLHFAHGLLLLPDHLVDIAILGHGDAFARGRPRVDRLQPPLEVRQPVDRYTRPLIRADPRPMRDIGDRVVAREVLVVLEPLVEHLEETAHLALITFDRVRDLLGRVAVEHVGLAHHRPDAAHLEHEPLDHARASLRIRRHQLSGLLGEVDQNRARLEHDEVVLVVVDDRRNAAVRIQLEVPRFLLLFLLERDRTHRVREPELLESDRDLVSVRRRSRE